MGMFRSAENEFLLCYDGMSRNDPLDALSLIALVQNSESTWIGMETRQVGKLG